MRALLHKQWLKRFMLKLNSIQFHISFYFSALILVIITIIGLVSYDKFSNTLENNAEEYNLQLTQQVKENIDYYIRYMDDISSIVQTSPILQQYFSGLLPILLNIEIALFLSLTLCILLTFQ